MFTLKYDYISENDSCMGIEEEYNSWQEAKNAMEELKKNSDYCHFEIIDTNID